MIAVKFEAGRGEGANLLKVFEEVRINKAASAFVQRAVDGDNVTL